MKTSHPAKAHAAKTNRPTGRAARLPFLAAACLLCATLFPAALSQAGDEGFRLVIKTAACVERDVVRLKDVAEVHGAIAPHLWASLGETELFKAPGRTDHPIVVERTRLRELLFNALGDTAYSCILPPRLTVQRGGRLIDQGELERRAVAFLTLRAEHLGGEAEFKDFHLPEFILLPDDFDRLEFEPPQHLRAGRVSFRIKIVSVSGRVARQIAASGFLNLWKYVPCAARPLNRLDHVPPESVTFLRKNLAYLGGEPWDGQGGPWRIMISLGASQPIYAEALEPVPVVSKGDKVTLVYAGEKVTLQAPAEAMADGGPGRRIPVRNLQTKATIQATVKDSKTVLVR